MKKLNLVILVLILFSGCRKKNTHDINATEDFNQSRSDTTQRIIITSPETAEIVCELGFIDLIVGITRECNYPPDLQEKPVVGTFGKVDIEKIIALEPSLVLTAGLEQEHLSVELRKLNIEVRSVFPVSIEQMITSVKELGILLGAEDEGERIASELTSRVNKCKQAQSFPQPRIYVEIYGNPLMSISDSSYVGELIELAGYDNIFSQLPRPYSRVKAEDVISYDPEYIIVTYPGIQAAEIKARKGWQKISALRNDRIITHDDIDTDLLVRATPRSLRSVTQLAGLREK